MRILMLKKDSNVKALVDAASGTTLEQLQRFNPHVDFDRLAPGVVLVVPDELADVEFPAGDPKSIGFEAMDSFIGFAKEALQASSKRLAQAGERAKAEAAALDAALASSGVAAALEKDAELRTQAEQALKRSKDDVKAAAADAKAFDALAKGVQAELAALSKRLA